MKQGVRLFVEPGTFFNQLQWSSHHWLILIGFFVASAVETQLGSSSALFQWYAKFITLRFGLDFGLALWAVTFARLALLIVGAWVATFLIWIVGTLLGERTSRRVLFRRMAVVFSILLFAYTSQHLSHEFEPAFLISLGLYAWSIALGFFAISEQFRLGHLQTWVVALLATIIVTQGWRFSNDLLRVKAAKAHAEMARRAQ